MRVEAKVSRKIGVSVSLGSHCQEERARKQRQHPTIGTSEASFAGPVACLHLHLPDAAVPLLTLEPAHERLNFSVGNPSSIVALLEAAE